MTLHYPEYGPPVAPDGATGHVEIEREWLDPECLIVLDPRGRLIRRVRAGGPPAACVRPPSAEPLPPGDYPTTLLDDLHNIADDHLALNRLAARGWLRSDDEPDS